MQDTRTARQDAQERKGAARLSTAALMRRFLGYYQGQMHLFVGDIACAVVVAGIDLAFPQILRTLTGGLFTQGASAILGALGYLAAGLVALYAVRFACRYFVAYWGHVMGARMESRMREDLFDAYQRMSFSFFDRNKSGDLMSRLVSDLFDISETAHHGPEFLLIGAVEIVGSFVILGFVNVPLTLVLAAVLVVLTAYNLRANLRMKAIFRENRVRISNVNSRVEDSLAGIRVVKAYVREPFETSKFHKAAQNIYDRFLSAEKILSWNMPLMNFTVYASILLISWLGANFIVAGSLTTGELMNLLTYCMSILMSLMMLSMIFVMVTMADESARRINEVLEATPTIKAPAEPIREVADGSIDFDGVSFKYSARAERQALSGIDLHIKSGETIGIMGGTGSAKSTLVNLIARLYDATEGRVRVGGVDVRDYDLDTLRNQVAVVLQRNVLFSGTINRLGAVHGIPTPQNERFYAAIKELESSFS